MRARAGRFTLLAAAATAATLLACQLLIDTRGRCEVDSDCLSTERCDANRCVPSEGEADGGNGGDGGCLPKSCTDKGRACGKSDDGCGTPLECGGCGEGQLCVEGQCQACGQGECSCPTGTKECQGSCISSGSCCTSAECVGGRECSGGSCTCATGTKECEGSCIPSASCCSSTECSGGRQCLGGACTCPAGTKECADACIDETLCCVDGDCANGKTCQGGKCLCPSGTQDCGSSCAATCPCGSGFKQCGASCIPTSNCCTSIDCASRPGECFEVQGVCDAGSCSYSPKDAGVACTADTNPCTRDQCNGAGACAHPANTGASCNDGNACTTPDSCNSSAQCVGTPVTCNSPPGECYQPTGTCSGGTCSYAFKDAGVACTTDTNPCTRDQCNDAGACAHPANTGASCNDGNACTNPDSCNSSAACVGTPISCTGTTNQCVSGTCTCNGGAACTGGKVCTGSGCVCPGGYKDCSGSCIPDSNCCTAAECGSRPHATAYCSGGNCGWNCNGSWEDCDGDMYSNGCEIDTSSNNNNCGYCSSPACSGARWECIASVCRDLCQPSVCVNYLGCSSGQQCYGGVCGDSCP